jgi:hypothetical protein
MTYLKCFKFMNNETKQKIIQDNFNKISNHYNYELIMEPLMKFLSVKKLNLNDLNILFFQSAINSSHNSFWATMNIFNFHFNYDWFPHLAIYEKVNLLEIDFFMEKFKKLRKEKILLLNTFNSNVNNIKLSNFEIFESYEKLFWYFKSTFNISDVTFNLLKSVTVIRDMHGDLCLKQ